MLSTIWSVIKTPFVWIKNGWLAFEAWVASYAPGWKTYIASGLGALGSVAATLQEYITGLPLDQFVTGTQIAVTTTVLFTLAFWFRRLAN